MDNQRRQARIRLEAAPAAAELELELETLKAANEPVFGGDRLPYNWRTEPDCAWLR